MDDFKYKYKCNSPPINGQCTNFVLLFVTCGTIIVFWSLKDLQVSAARLANAITSHRQQQYVMQTTDVQTDDRTNKHEDITTIS